MGSHILLKCLKGKINGWHVKLVIHLESLIFFTCSLLVISEYWAWAVVFVTCQLLHLFIDKELEILKRQPCVHIVNRKWNHAITTLPVHNCTWQYSYISYTTHAGLMAWIIMLMIEFITMHIKYDTSTCMYTWTLRWVTFIMLCWVHVKSMSHNMHIIITCIHCDGWINE